MKFNKQIEAKKLRIKGKSINEIAKQLDVSKGSVSAWVKNVPLTVEQINYLHSYKEKNHKYNNEKKQNAKNLRTQYQEFGKIRARQNDLLHCMGCMLYWAEGTKDKNTVSFTNSDVNMLKLFISFMKKEFGICSDNIVLTVNCYLTCANDVKKIMDYWIKELDIVGCKTTKPTIKLTNNPIQNFGVCRISIHNTKIVQHIYGAIQQYAGFNNNYCIENNSSRQTHK